jgi:hypothetical protein
MIDDAADPIRKVTERTFVADKHQGRSELGMRPIMCRTCIFWEQGPHPARGECRRHSPPHAETDFKHWCGDWVANDYSISLEMVLRDSGLKPSDNLGKPQA